MTEFFTVITDAGRELVAQATQAGEKVNITHMAVGDGGGVPVTPNEEQTHLVNECWRGLVATYKQEGTNIIIDTYIPPDEGNFTIREMGVFTADGVLFAVCNTPAMPKVLPIKGAVDSFVFGMKLDVTNIDMSYIEIHTNPMLPFINEGEKGQPNGVALLNPDGVLEIKYGGTKAKTAQEAIYNLGCMPRENLLDNAHFVGGGTDGNFPINPKGLKRYNTVGSCIPRWKLQNANSSLEIVDDGIILRNSATEFEGAIIPLLQKVARNANQETVTYAIIASEVSGDWFMAYGNTTNGNKKIDIGLTFITVPAERVTLNNPIFYLFKTSKNSNDYIKFQDLKLEKGDTQTLAWEDTDGNLHLFEPSDYVRELVKCQRYLQVGKPAHFYAGAMYGQKEGVFIVPTPVEMRIRQPSIKVDTVQNVRIISYNGTLVQLTNDELSVLGSDCFGIKVKVTLSGDKVLPIGTAVIADALFTFDAEL